MPIEEHHKQWIVLGAAVGAAAIVAGFGLGYLSRSAGWGFGALAIPVGLAIGLAGLAFPRMCLSERLIAVVAATAVGLGLFAWASDLPPWRAETAVPDAELDDLCLRVTALQLCGQRQIMGVFAFEDVPEDVLEEARGRVDAMGIAEKRAICDRTFGSRINAGPRGEPGAAVTGWAALWVSLALALAVSPTLLQHVRAR